MDLFVSWEWIYIFFIMAKKELSKAVGDEIGNCVMQCFTDLVQPASYIIDNQTLALSRKVLIYQHQLGHEFVRRELFEVI